MIGRPNKPGWETVGELTTLAMTLAFCVLIGFFAGRWIGKKLGFEEIGILAGLGVGVAAAGVELARAVKRLGAPRAQRGSDERGNSSENNP